jgi:hypothetical protein
VVKFVALLSTMLVTASAIVNVNTSVQEIGGNSVAACRV